jgi:2',3'-cyclic-nucleotide 2'-phosphodiesterase (5'-nucleotidase family)
MRFGFLLAVVAWSVPATVAAKDGGRRDDDRTRITILQTSDLHHHANGSDHVGLDVDPVTGRGATGSYARIAAYVGQVRATAGNPVLLVDSGDWTMGTLYDLTLGKQPLALRFLDLLHYDCVTLGNHEFDYTSKGLSQILAAAQASFGFHTPIVASNLNLNGDADLLPFVGERKAIRALRVQELPNGLKVGYIGLMGKAAALDAPAAAPVSFSDFATDAAFVQQLVDELRNRRGADLVIALSHSGTDPTGTSGEDVDLAKHVTGIDLIASGHTHTPLSTSHAVTNGAWTTQIVDAGAFGTNVFRIDLRIDRRTRTTQLVAATNVAMTDASLAAVAPGLRPDPLSALIVGLTDHQLNLDLGPFFTETFADYDPANLGKGIYHPVGSTAQDLVPNSAGPVPSPNGLGDLAADAVRSVPNAIIAQTFAATGGNFPGFDFAPFQAAVVASGVLRGTLKAGVPLSFADIYDLLSLGISPDPAQALPVGYPLVSAYLDVADVKKLGALQLVVQTNLASSDFYLNLSGLRFDYDPVALNTYFKFATAAGVLQVASAKAANGSALAAQALAALARLGSDGGASLLAAAATNPYAGAMVRLNDAAPSAANLGALGQVAAAAAADSAQHTKSVSALIVSKAVAAVATVSGFSPADAANVGAAAPLDGTARVRVAVDLFAVLLLGAVESQFGVAITPFQSATGPATLSSADLPGILANRIDASPATAGVQELKEWMALLSYLETGLNGTVSPAYASTPDFTQFATFGPAVQIRNATYPLASIGQFLATASSLQSGP